MKQVYPNILTLILINYRYKDLKEYKVNKTFIKNRLTASSLNSSPWRQDSSFSALSGLEITYSGNLLTRIGNQASFKSSLSFKSGLKLENTVSLIKNRLEIFS